jgi:hypothetical protein
LRSAKEKYDNQPKYNLLRDEIEEFHFSNKLRRDEVSARWIQCDLLDPFTA